jgi:hypothetical protein
VKLLETWEAWEPASQVSLRMVCNKPKMNLPETVASEVPRRKGLSRPLPYTSVARARSGSSSLRALALNNNSSFTALQKL